MPCGIEIPQKWGYKSHITKLSQAYLCNNNKHHHGMNVIAIAAAAIAVAAAAAASPTIQAAQAWNLTVNIVGAQFGHRNITVNLKGQFGYTDSSTVLNSPGVSTSFDVPEDAIPVGSTYRVCGHTEGIVNTLLEACNSFTHTQNGNSVVTLNLREKQA
jgi:opacity protein-like surface antigen